MSLIYYADTQPEPKNGKEDEAETEPRKDNNEHAKKGQPEDKPGHDERGMATYTCKQCIDAHARIWPITNVSMLIQNYNSHAMHALHGALALAIRNFLLQNYCVSSVC